jgi:hypothetical protein
MEMNAPAAFPSTAPRFSEIPYVELNEKKPPTVRRRYQITTEINKYYSHILRFFLLSKEILKRSCFGNCICFYPQRFLGCPKNNIAAMHRDEPDSRGKPCCNKVSHLERFYCYKYLRLLQ